MARYLDENEKALWQKVADTIEPLHRRAIKTDISKAPNVDLARSNGLLTDDLSTITPKIDAPKINGPTKNAKHRGAVISDALGHANDANPTRADLERALSKPIVKTPAKPAAKHRANSLNNPNIGVHKGLDGNWDKRIGRGVIIPDINIDLHGAGLQSAYDRLDGALEQAKAQKLRVILLVTGRQRDYDRTSGQGRGGIRAVISDWLSASRHSDNIASVRNAHPRHGGAGALYIILRKA